MNELDVWAAAGVPKPGANPLVPQQTQQVEPWSNHIQADPYLTENIEWLRERRGTSDVEGRKQRAYGDIDELAQGQSKGIEAAMARRGIGNSGIAVDNQNKLAGEAARAKVRAGMDIDASETARQDALVMGAGNIMRAPSAYALGQGQLNLGQQQANQGQQNWLAQFQAQQQQQAMGNYLQMLQMFQNQPGNSGGGSGGSYGGGLGAGSVYDDPWFKDYLKGSGGSSGGFGASY